MRRLEHIGIASSDSESALKVCREVLDRGPYKSESVEHEGVRTLFFQAGGTKLEFLESTAEDSPIARFLEKRGPGIHHLAFEVDSVDDEASRLQGLGYRLLGDVRPGADGKRIIFLHPKDTAGVLVELCEQTSFPTIVASDGVEPVFLVDANQASDGLAHGLLRYGTVARTGSPGGAPGSLDAGFGGTALRLVATVNPLEEWSLAGKSAPPLFVVRLPAPDSAGSAGTEAVFSIERDGVVETVIPAHVWASLPDPWSLAADLVSGGVRP